MPIVSTIISDLVGGVSRQPETQRFTNQMQEIDNCFTYMTTGLEKRNGSTYIKNITDPTGTLFIHWHERSSSQRYIFIFKQDGTTPLRIFKADGTTCTVNYQAGKSSTLKAYLNTAPTNIRAVSFDDTTAVLNTSVTTATETSTVSYLYPAITGTPVDNNGNAHNRISWNEFDLPPLAINEYWYAREDALGNPSGWYKSISTGAQPWYERVRTPMAHSTYDPTTMPIRIVQTSDTVFEVKEIEWKPRYSGDGLTNPPASFVGKQVTDICLHRNRLWMVAGENVVGSQTGDYFNFWQDSFSQLIDSDPIDVKLGSAQVSKINYIQPFNKALVLFTNGNQQYELRSRDTLTPTTVSVLASTAYTSPNLARPVIAGSQLYWASNKGAFSQIYEYISDDAAAQSIAQDITAHIDTYLPDNLSYFSASASADILVTGTGDDGDLYICFMYWQGPKKLQNAWSKLTPSDNGTTGKILSARFFGDDLYLLQRTDGVLRINKIEMRTIDDYPSYLPRIDSKRIGQGSWNKANQETSFTTDKCMDIDVVYLGVDWEPYGGEGIILTPKSVTDNGDGTCTVKVDGEWNEADAWLGCNFTANVEISKQYLRNRDNIALLGVQRILKAMVAHRNTGYYTLEIDPGITPSDIRVMTYTPKVLGSSFIASQNYIEEDEVVAYKIMGSNETTTINIKSNHPSPMNITSIEFASNFVQRKTSPVDR